MNNTDVRKLVTIKTINKITPIKDADRIEKATIGGWEVVVPVNQFKEQEEVIYFEIDSFLPNNIPQFSFLSDKNGKTVMSPEGKEVFGHVLKTMSMRGQISQGFIQKIEAFEGLKDSLDKCVDSNEKNNITMEYFTNLGVFKYEKPLPVDNRIIDHYPSFTRKTDSERVQNLSDDILNQLRQKGEWKATEKVDGTSSTWWKDSEGQLHVASRNYETAVTGIYEKIAKDYNLYELLQPNDVLKGEIVGEGIQGNKLKISGKKLLIFDWESENDFPKELERYLVPTYELSFPHTVEEAVQQVNGLRSLVNPNVQAEGVVWWDKNGNEYKELEMRSNFKAINNKFLLKDK